VSATTRSLGAVGTVFFLVAMVVIDLTELVAERGFFFGSASGYGVILLVIDALSLLAAVAAWRGSRWGYGIGAGLAAFVVGSTLLAIAGGDQLGGPVAVFYTSAMIVVRLLVVFFALDAWIATPSERGRQPRGSA
jgi:hypothetical protein